jgi:hypothetical protein
MMVQLTITDKSILNKNNNIYYLNNSINSFNNPLILLELLRIDNKISNKYLTNYINLEYNKLN